MATSSPISPTPQISKTEPYPPPTTPPKKGLPLPEIAQPTIAQKPERHPSILEAFQKSFPQLSIQTAQLILKTIYTAQKNLGPTETKTEMPTDNFPYFIAIERDAFHVLSSTAGKGGNGEVSHGLLFSIERIYFDETLLVSPSKPLDMARKRSNKSLPQGSNFSLTLEKEKQFIEAVSPSKRLFFCRTLRTSNDDGGRSHALMPYYPCNFAEIKWIELSHPVDYLIHKMTLTLLPLQALHNMAPPLVHRDIKEANVMDTKDNDLIKLIDFDQATPAFFEPSFTVGTPLYLNPRSFGTEGETLINQKKRYGTQRPCDDMYAFSMMGIRMTLNLCSAFILLKSKEENVKILQKISQLKTPQFLIPIDGRPAFTEEELHEIGLKYPNQVYFLHHNIRTNISERIAILPSHDTYLTSFEDILHELSLTNCDKLLLQSFFIYCVKQKFATDLDRHNAATAYTTLLQLREESRNTPSSSAAHSSETQLTAKKRRRTKPILQDTELNNHHKTI